MRAAWSVLLIAMISIPLAGAISSPNFEAPIYGGGTFRLSDYRGKVVVLVFAQPTCSHCREFIPMLANAWRSDPELSSDNYVVAVAMYSPNNPSAAEPAFRSYNPPSSWLLILASWSNLVQFGVKYTSTVIIIDPSGNVYAKLDPRYFPKIPLMVNATIEKAKEASKLGASKSVTLALDVPKKAKQGETIILNGVVKPRVSEVSVVLVSPRGKKETFSAVPDSTGSFHLPVSLDEAGRWTVKVIAGPSSEQVSVIVEPTEAMVLYGTHDREAASFLGMKSEPAGEELSPGNLIILGGPKANPLSKLLNRELGVAVDINGSMGIIKVGKQVWRLKVRYGRLDYALVISTERDGRSIILGEGLTRYGTRAAALLIAKGKLSSDVTIIRWSDDNGDGEVQLDEVYEIYRSSLP